MVWIFGEANGRAKEREMAVRIRSGGTDEVAVDGNLLGAVGFNEGDEVEIIVHADSRALTIVAADEPKAERESRVRSANEQAGKEHQTRVVEYRAIAFGHAIQLRCKIPELVDVPARDGFVAI